MYSKEQCSNKDKRVVNMQVWPKKIMTSIIKLCFSCNYISIPNVNNFSLPNVNNFSPSKSVSSLLTCSTLHVLKFKRDRSFFASHSLCRNVMTKILINLMVPINRNSGIGVSTAWTDGGTIHIIHLSST